MHTKQQHRPRSKGQSKSRYHLTIHGIVNHNAVHKKCFYKCYYNVFKMFGQHETYANIICNRFQKSTFLRIFVSQTLPTRLMAAGNSLTDEDFTPRPVASRTDWSTVAARP